MNRFWFSVKQINRDPITNEMLKMRQQLELLQAELCARGGGCSPDEIQVLKIVFHDKVVSLAAIIPNS